MSELSPAGVNLLLVLVGLGGLAYVVRTTGPDRGQLFGAFASAGVATLAFIVARRGLALESKAASAGVAWWHEMLVGGAPLQDSPYPMGAERLAGVALWLPLWAVMLHPDLGRNPEGRRGPWILALLPLVLVALFSLVPLGVPAAETSHANRDGALRIVGMALAVYAVVMAAYWILRRRASRS